MESIRPQNRRILVIDDNESIRADFQKILAPVAQAAESLDSARNAFLGEPEPTQAPSAATNLNFELSCASQGQEGLQLARQALEQDEPFGVAFVDVRMPPGWDGIETIKHLWKEDARLQVVICTAYADYSFDEIIEELGSSDRLLILKKPFEPVEVRQLAGALCEKWNVARGEESRQALLLEAERETREYALSLAESNAALEEARQRAEAASQVKSQFLANMSHEVRTPMNAILGYLDLLFQPGVAPSKQLEYTAIIKSSGTHLLSLVNDILDISRVESCQLPTHYGEFSPALLAQEVVELARNDAVNKGLELKFECREGVPTMVQSDPVRMRQILLNLIGNAIKFTEQGEVRLLFESGPSEQEGMTDLIFSVLDSGIGILPEDQKRIFDLFTQVDESSTRASGGVGLGLSISSRLAQMLGGAIEVESTPGQGSTFRVNIPALVPEKRSLSTELAPKPEPSSPTPTALRGRVLLVEDVPVNQILIATILRKTGIEVELAENGKLACDKVETAIADGNPFELVLMDMQMPVMDGYEASKHLRTQGIDVPILALTAHAMATDREKCLEAGCTEYLTKPVDRRELLLLCARFLDEGPQAPLPADGEFKREPSSKPN